MIVALILASGKSSGWPGKHLVKICGKPLLYYPIRTAKSCADKVYLQTEPDAKEIISIAESYGVELILKEKDDLSENAFQYGWRRITEREGTINYFIPMFGNSPSTSPEMIKLGIEALNDTYYDSAVTVSRYNMWSPLRAMKIEDNRILPFIDASYFKQANCDRNSQGNTYFIDNSVFVVRPHCMDYSNGRPPYKWIGKKIYPLIQEGGLDLDYQWQFGQAEYWIRNYENTHSTKD